MLRAVAIDPYAVLGVKLDSTDAEIQAAFKTKVKAFHPDLHPDDPQAPDRFRRIQEAYDLIRDADSRAKFNRGAVRGWGGASNSAADANKSAKDVFEGLFSTGRKGPSGGPAGSGGLNLGNLGGLGGEKERDHGPGGIRATRAHSKVAGGGWVHVPFEAALLGGQHQVEVKTADAHNAKKIWVNLPPNLKEEDQLRIEGAIVTVVVDPHPYFKREGDDILLDVPLTIPELAFGAKIEVPTLHGPVEVNIPGGTKPGQRLRLRGKGVNENAHQYCVIAYAPPDLSRGRVTEAIRWLDTEDDRSPRPWDPPGSVAKTRKS